MGHLNLTSWVIRFDLPSVAVIVSRKLFTNRIILDFTIIWFFLQVSEAIIVGSLLLPDDVSNVYTAVKNGAYCLVTHA